MSHIQDRKLFCQTHTMIKKKLPNMKYGPENDKFEKIGWKAMCPSYKHN